MSQGQFSLFILYIMLNSLVMIGSSPQRKRRRMSSPIFPEFIDNLSPEDLQDLSRIDAVVSQSNYPATPLRSRQPARFHAEGLKPSQSTSDKRRSSELDPGVVNDPATTQPTSTSVQPTSNGGIQPGSSTLTTPGFTSVRAMAATMTNDDDRSPSPDDPPPEQDYDAWFDTSSMHVPALAGFQSASTPSGTGCAGFTSAGKGVPFQASEDVLEKVKKRMRAWEADFEEEVSYMRPSTPQTSDTPPRRPVTPQRPPLNSEKNPASPTPSTPRPISPQHITLTHTAKQKPFKPPLLQNKTNLTNSVPALLSNVARSNSSVSQFKLPLLSSTSASALPKPSTPTRAASDSAFRTPVRLGGAHRPVSVKKFTTPFKPGMRPGEPGRAKLQEGQEKKQLQDREKDQTFQIQMHSPPRKPVYDVPPSLKSPSDSRKEKEKTKEYRFFDLSQSNLSSPLTAFNG